MPGIEFLIAVSITVEPVSASTVWALPNESMKVILTMQARCRPNRRRGDPSRECLGMVSIAHLIVVADLDNPGSSNHPRARGRPAKDQRSATSIKRCEA